MGKRINDNKGLGLMSRRLLRVVFQVLTGAGGNNHGGAHLTVKSDHSKLEKYQVIMWPMKTRLKHVRLHWFNEGGSTLTFFDKCKYLGLVV